MRNNSGQTIIEAVVALTVILIILTAIAIVIINGLANSEYVKNQNLANKYAQQGMEIVRNVYSNDKNTFDDIYINGTTYCVDNDSSALTTDNCSESTVNTGPNFIRTITFNDGVAPCSNANETRVTVIVRWSSGKCPEGDTERFCHRSELSSCFLRGDPAQNP